MTLAVRAGNYHLLLKENCIIMLGDNGGRRNILAGVMSWSWTVAEDVLQDEEMVITRGG